MTNVFPPSFFEQLSDRLELAVYDINHGFDMATIAEQLKEARAQLAEARQAASDAVTDSADASRVVLAKVEEVRKETATLRSEIAELTNGPPADVKPAYPSYP